MKKKVLALLLGGAMAIGGLSMQVPATAEAMTSDECNYYSKNHIKSYEVTTVDGQLTVTIDIEEFETRTPNGGVILYAFEKQLEKQTNDWGAEDYPIYEQRGWSGELDIDKSGTYTFTGLTSGKKYYVYAIAYDLHGLQPSEDSGQHYAAYLGSGTPSGKVITREECNWRTEPHVESYDVTVVDGRLTVNINLKEFEGDVTAEQAGFTLVALEKQLGNPTKWGEVSDALLDLGYPDELCLWARTASGTYTFEGLSAGKTYYVYCTVFDHDWGPESMSTHDVMCLGSGTPTVGPANISSGSGSSGNVPSTSVPSTSAPADDDSEEAGSYENTVADQIQTAQPGSTVVMEKGVTTLSNSTMKELLAKGDVSMKLEFTYMDKEYVIIIPAGAALDNDIPYYGPLYLAQHFGNKAGTNASGTGAAYEVQSGDNLSKIAKKNNMTLKQLLAKNPQIKDPNKIIVGQKINL